MKLFAKLWLMCSIHHGLSSSMDDHPEKNLAGASTLRNMFTTFCVVSGLLKMTTILLRQPTHCTIRKHINFSLTFTGDSQPITASFLLQQVARCKQLVPISCVR